MQREKADIGCRCSHHGPWHGSVSHPYLLSAHLISDVHPKKVYRPPGWYLANAHKAQGLLYRKMKRKGCTRLIKHSCHFHRSQTAHLDFVFCLHQERRRCTFNDLEQMFPLLCRKEGQSGSGPSYRCGTQTRPTGCLIDQN